MAELYPKYPVVIIDDEPHALLSAETVLKMEGITNIIKASGAKAGIKAVKDGSACAAVLDITMPDMTGLEALDILSAEAPYCRVIMLTGLNEVETAIACMKKGAKDYLVKPVEKDKLVGAVKAAIEISELENENMMIAGSMQADLKDAACFEEIITADPKMINIFRYIEAVAPGKNSILISGETGTGKELMARAVHKAGKRKGGFIALNAAGLDDNMFSDTLFGHKKGAFTGADSERPGIIKKAEGGTLFLDEIGDLSMASQVKLLRLLQEAEYTPLGSDTPVKADIRVVAATNKSMEELSSSPSFRKDLFYRLKSHHVAIPALKERKTDIMLLAKHFAVDAAIGKEAMSALMGYGFPGNVRELKSMMEDASKRDGGITPENLGIKKMAVNEDGPGIYFGGKLPTLDEADAALAEEALKRSQGNQSAAAAMLGITRQAMNKRMKK